VYKRQFSCRSRSSVLALKRLEATTAPTPVLESDHDVIRDEHTLEIYHTPHCSERSQRRSKRASLTRRFENAWSESSVSAVSC